VLVGVVCIGFSAIFTRLAGVPGVVSAFYRVLIASAALVPLWLLRGLPMPDRRTLLLSTVAGVLFGVDLSLWNVSLFLTNAANATVLAYLAPVWVGLGTLFILKDRLGRSYWPGTVLAILGMFTIVGIDKMRAAELGWGNTLAVIASFFYAGYLLITQVARSKSGTLAFTTISVLASTATLLAIALARGERLGGFSPQTWAALLALGLISHVVGWLALNYALGHAKASTVSVSLLGQPVITALAAIPILGETLSPNQIAGGVLILLGIYLVNRT
jgi:drug/metabolite transporter (DMT)-like permease